MRIVGKVDVFKDLEEFLSNNENFSILSETQIQELSEKQFNSEELKELAKKRIKYQPEISLSIHGVFKEQRFMFSHRKKIPLRPLTFWFSFPRKVCPLHYRKAGGDEFSVVKYIAHGGDGPVMKGLKKLLKKGSSSSPKMAVLEKFTFNCGWLKK